MSTPGIIGDSEVVHTGGGPGAYPLRDRVYG
jgi:hypothetical protein